MTDPIARVEAVLEAATSGDWLVTEKRGKRDGYVRAWDGDKAVTVADCRYKNGEVDAAAIVLTHALTPEALAVVRAAEAYRVQWESLSFLPNPAFHEAIDYEYDCLTAALSAFTELVQSALGEEGS